MEYTAAQVEESRRRKEDEKRKRTLEDNKYLAEVRSAAVVVKTTRTMVFAFIS